MSDFNPLEVVSPGSETQLNPCPAMPGYIRG